MQILVYNASNKKQIDSVDFSRAPLTKVLDFIEKWNLSERINELLDMHRKDPERVLELTCKFEVSWP